MSTTSKKETSNEQVKVIRFKTDVYNEINKKAEEQGVTFNDALEQILKGFFDLPQDPVIELNGQIKCWLDSKGYTPSRFPEDVILLTFEMIRESQVCLDLYHRSVSEHGEGVVNRRIGLFVKHILKATVRGRSVPFGKKKIAKHGYLIKSYSFLKPS